jgi:hypothetical protein
MGDEVRHSIIRRQLIKVAKQDFAVISELAGVYYDDCIYQLLLGQLRRNIRVLFGEETPRYNLNFVYKYKTFFLRRFHSSLPSIRTPKTSETPETRTVPLLLSFRQ